MNTNVTTLVTTLSRKSSTDERKVALRQIYAQVLERQPYECEQQELKKQEKDFLSGKLGVRHFLKALGCSQVYLDNFYYNCSNLKFIEWCFKHFLGRAPIDREEMQVYVDVLMHHGVETLISEILGSEEYRKAFGCFTIPHARQMKFYPSTQNFLQSQLVNNEHYGRRGRIVPTMYWRQIGMDCDAGECTLDRHNQLQSQSEASQATQANSLEEEVAELVKILQKEESARTELLSKYAQR